MRNMPMPEMLNRWATGASVSVMLMVVPAGAQGMSECSCVAPAGSAATIVTAQGRVLLSRAAGFAPAAAGSQLTGGSIMVGPQSSAVVSLGGGCSVSLVPNSDATLSLRNGSLCLSANQTSPAGRPANEAASGAGGFSIGASEYLFLGGLAGFSGAWATSAADDSEPVSR
jgi:hypothetical protein